MNWADVYMFCFLVGFILSLLSLVIGAFHVHLPGLDHLHLDHHVHFGGGAAVHMDNGQHAAGAHLSPFNFSTAMAFLAWFGGAGYLLTAWGKIGALAVLGFAAMAGATGAAIVFMFLAKVLMRTDSALYESDYRMDGVLGRVSSGIRQGAQGKSYFRRKEYVAPAAHAARTGRRSRAAPRW